MSLQLSLARNMRARTRSVSRLTLSVLARTQLVQTLRHTLAAPRSAVRLQQSAAASRAFSSAAPAHSYNHVNENFTRTDCGLWIDRSLPPTFKKVLIANRGEIACRVMRTCKQLGIRTVAVYSDADAKSMHVQMADEAYRIGEPPAAKSYLSFEAILDVAKRSGAEAIHPGYGFLSENAGFADACEKAGVIFIGPPASAINAMGSKSASKIIMTNAKVPVVPGYHGDKQDKESLRKEAARVGYPIMLKAVLGGGGKGMRIVRSAEEFDDMLDACKREALASFKDDRVLLERYIVRPRHIEFQVFADKHGNAVHLFERDCSVQRRHQKVLEEAPANAVNAAKAVGYVGAGTVEFIFDAETDEYFFMEMNTRLQVEHPVTEMIMRRDLVQWQLHVAAGHKIPDSQKNISASARGHALEARVYAENPTNNFLPATGKLVHLRAPANALDVRVETGVRQGDEVSIFYDPMIAKLVVWGADRNAALAKMSRALEEYQIVGPPTNIAFLQRSVNHPVFHKGRVETGFIAQNMSQLLPRESPTPEPHVLAIAVASLLHEEAVQRQSQTAAQSDPTSPWADSTNRRLNLENARTVSLLKTNPPSTDEAANKKVATTVQASRNSDGSLDLKVQLTCKECCFQPLVQFADGSSLNVQGQFADSRDIKAVVGGQAYRATVVHSGSDVHVFVNGHKTQLTKPEVVFGFDKDKHGAGSVAPMAGKVVKVLVQPKQEVKKGAQLVIMEAMKMEHIIRAPKDGVIDKVLYKPGDFVEGGKLLVQFVKGKEDDD